MKIESEMLAAAMRMSSIPELHKIITNPNREYTSAAREAAARELNARAIEPNNIDDQTKFPTPSPLASTLSRLPRTIREVFWLSTITASLSTLLLLLAVVALITGWQGVARQFLAGSGPTLLLAIVSWLLLIGIVQERCYIRPLIIALVLAFAAYGLANDILSARDPFLTAIQFGVFLFIAWRLLRSTEISEYYKRLRERRSSFYESMQS